MAARRCEHLFYSSEAKTFICGLMAPTDLVPTGAKEIEVEFDDPLGSGEKGSMTFLKCTQHLPVIGVVFKPEKVVCDQKDFA